MAQGSARIVVGIVAITSFMENLDATAIITSLPAIAADVGADPLDLKLAITAYLLSLVVFTPMSGWIADRFGGRNAFRIAVTAFVIGSIGCALSHSLAALVAARMLQGAGGALMTPIGRLVLIRTVDKQALVDAMAWVAMPALVGPVLGPPLGGIITTYASWHWIFLINVPIGLLGIALSTRYMPSTSTSARVPFDLVGAALAGLGMAGLVFGFSTAGLDYLSVPTVMALILGGTAFFVAYLVHARRTPVPLLDFSLLRVQAFQASFFGGFAFRIGVAALTFLLPLLLQLGFGLDPFQSGLVTFSGALGALTMKTAAARILKRFGFRRVLLVNALVGSGFIAACAAFSYSTPFWLIIMVLLVGGFFRSLQFTAINVLAFAEVPPDRMSRATTLAAVGLQLSWSAGVALGAALVEYVTRHTASVITVADFSLAFLVVGAISASSVLLFLRLPADVCAELSGPAPLPARRN